MQATSIIGHERQQSDRLVLPTSDEDSPIPKGDTRGAHFDRRMDEMSRLFDTVSKLLNLFCCPHKIQSIGIKKFILLFWK